MPFLRFALMTQMLPAETLLGATYSRLRDAGRVTPPPLDAGHAPRAILELLLPPEKYLYLTSTRFSVREGPRKGECWLLHVSSYGK